MTLLNAVADFFVTRPVRFYWPNWTQVAWAAASWCWFGFFSLHSPRVYRHISNAHCIPVSVLALLAINDVIPEWATMIFSASYMLIDGVLGAWRLSKGRPWPAQCWTFVYHHIGVLPLYAHPMISAPACYLNKATSRLLLIELANPFLNRWDVTKSYQDFATAYACMFAFRGVYCGWYCWWITRVCEGVNVLVALIYVLWVSQIALWLVPEAPKLWQYDEIMASERGESSAKAAKRSHPPGL